MAALQLDNFDPTQLDAPPNGARVTPLGSFDPAHLDAPQMGGLMRYPAMAGSSLLKGALEGAGAVGDLQDAMQRAFNSGIYNPLRTAIMGAPKDFSQQSQSPLNSASLVGAGKSLGAVDRPDLQPQTTPERFLAAGSEGAGGALPFLPLAGAGLANAGRALVQGTAAGTGGEGLAEAFPQYPNLARASGAILGAYGSGKALNAASRIGSAVAGNSTPTLEAYRNLGIDPALAGDVTGSPFLQMAQAYAAKSPGGAGRVGAASEKAVDQWGNALEGTADALGGSRTLEGAGRSLQMEGQNWLNQFSAESRKAWNAVDLAIPPRTPIAATNYAQTLDAVRSQMPGAPATANALQPALSRNLLDSLLKDVRGGPLAWQDVKGIRTRIGEKLADPQLVGDTGYTELKRIYGALSTDMQNAAAARGPAAVQAFNGAADLTRQGHQFVEGVLSQFLKGNQIAPETAAASALDSGYNGGTTLQAVRQQMPKAADELAAYKLRDMALANPGQQNASASRLSPGTFLTDRARLAPEAQQALFGADPDIAQRVQDLSTAAGSMKSTERYLNTSNTGSHGATAHAMAGVAGAVPAAIEGYHLGGIPGAAASMGSAIAAPFVPSWLASRITSNPSLTRLLAAPGGAPQGAGLLSIGAAYPGARGLLPLFGQ